MNQEESERQTYWLRKGNMSMQKKKILCILGHKVRVRDGWWMICLPKGLYATMAWVWNPYAGSSVPVYDP